MSYRFAPAAVCETCWLTAAGYSEHELGYAPTAEPLALLAGQCIPEGQVSTFGTAACEGCGDRLAGARYALSVDTHTLRPGATHGEVAPGAITDPTYGRLMSPGEVFTSDAGQTYVAGAWGPSLTFVNVAI